MLRRLSAALFSAALLLGVQLAHATPASAAPRVLYYDAGQAREFVTVVEQSAQLWNSQVANVRLLPVPAGRTPNIRVYADDGWPRTYTTSLGNGRWYMGRQAVQDGYFPLRIAAHEFGHILGLPDRRTGQCADLMSGSSAPTSCTNPNPNPQERSSVDANFRTASTAPARSYLWQDTGAPVPAGR